MGYASNFQQLYLLRALMGISEALYIPSALSLIADWHEGKSRSLAIGIHMTGLYVGQAVGGFGATVAAAFSWHATFQWFGIIGIVYSIVLLLLLHDKVVENTAASQTAPAKGGLFKGLSVVLSTWAGYPVLFRSALPSRLGDQELASYFVLRELRHSDVAGRTDVNHHDSRLFIGRSHLWRHTLRQVGAA